MERGDGVDPLERSSDTDAGTRPDNYRELRRASRAGLLVVGVLSILLKVESDGTRIGDLCARIAEPTCRENAHGSPGSRPLSRFTCRQIPPLQRPVVQRVDRRVG